MYKTITNRFNSCFGLEIHIPLANSRFKLLSRTNNRIFDIRCHNDLKQNSYLDYDGFDFAETGLILKINVSALKSAASLSQLLQCQINKEFIFERKHYFYYDLPYGYQVTQKNYPIASKGHLKIHYCDNNVFWPNCTSLDVFIKNIHIENDSAKQQTSQNGQISIDLSRCNIPLIEVVTEPCFNSINHALCFVKWLKKVCMSEGIYCDHLESIMRFDINISTNDTLTGKSSDRIEIKNLSKYQKAISASKYIVTEQIKQLCQNDDRNSLPIKNTNQQCFTVYWKNNSISMKRLKISSQNYCFTRETNLPVFHINNIEYKKCILQNFIINKNLRFCLDLASNSHPLQMKDIIEFSDNYDVLFFKNYFKLFDCHNLPLEIFLRHFHMISEKLGKMPSLDVFQILCQKLHRFYVLVERYLVDECFIDNSLKLDEFYIKNENQLFSDIIKSNIFMETSKDKALDLIKMAISKCKTMQLYLEKQDIKNLVNRYKYLHKIYAKNTRSISNRFLYDLFSQILQNKHY